LEAVSISVGGIGDFSDLTNGDIDGFVDSEKEWIKGFCCLDITDWSNRIKPIRRGITDILCIEHTVNGQYGILCGVR